MNYAQKLFGIMGPSERRFIKESLDSVINTGKGTVKFEKIHVFAKRGKLTDLGFQALGIKI